MTQHVVFSKEKNCHIKDHIKIAANRSKNTVDIRSIPSPTIHYDLGSQTPAVVTQVVGLDYDIEPTLFRLYVEKRQAARPANTVAFNINEGARMQDFAIYPKTPRLGVVCDYPENILSMTLTQE